MMCADDGFRLQDFLEGALTNPNDRDRLLQQPELLQQMMKNHEARDWLFRQACQDIDVNRKRKARQMIIQMMQASGGIWRGGTGVHPDDYGEALARTWLWFSQKFDEYDPAIASFTTWFNTCLRWRIVDVSQERGERERQETHASQQEDEDRPRDIAAVPAPPTDKSFLTIEDLKNLAQRDPGQQLQRKRIQQYPHVNGQKLVLAVLTSVEAASEIEWNTLVTQFGVPEVKLRNFYRTVQPLFQKMYQDDLDV